MEKKSNASLSNGKIGEQIVNQSPTTITIKGILGLLLESIDIDENDNENEKKRVISLGMGDPTAYSCFHTPLVAQDSVIHSLQSQNFNGYAPTVGLLQTRRYSLFFWPCSSFPSNSAFLFCLRIFF